MVPTNSNSESWFNWWVFDSLSLEFSVEEYCVRSSYDCLAFVCWEKINFVLLCDEIKVPMRLTFIKDGLVERDEIVKVVKGLILDYRKSGIRERIEELKDDVVDALKDHRSSTTTNFQYTSI